MTNTASSLFNPGTKRQRYEILKTQLSNERATFIPHWKDVGELVFPRRPRFMVTDANKGDRRNQKIIDITGTLAARTLRSGMMGGITSPARPWFRLTTPDPGLAEYGPVKNWLYTVTQRLSWVYLKSNIYQILPMLYGDMSTFGTAPIILEEDFESVIRGYSFPVGSYMISNDHRGKVCVFFREFRMTVRQVIQKFGKINQHGKIDWENFSSHVRNMWESGQTETWVDVCHLIKPNDEYNPKMLSSKYKKFTSCYYESGYQSGSKSNYLQNKGDEDKYLRESGYDYFPVLCARWEVTGEDAYGTDCPGFTALGDIKQLQYGEKKGAQAIDKMVNPAMQGPTSLRGQKISILPGDTTFIDSLQGQQGFRPTHEVTPKIQELEMKQAQIRVRIDKAYYRDLFQLISSDQVGKSTATEISVRHEENLVLLGPVLEQLNQDVLDPMTDITYDNMDRQGWIPEPPEEIHGMSLRVEYISIMAQAQKISGISGLERFANFVGVLAKESGDPSILAKVNMNELVNIYGEMTSVPPTIIRSDEDAQEIIAQRQRAAQMAEAPAQIKDMAGAAQQMGQTPMDQDSLLNRLLEQSRAGQLDPQIAANS